MNVLLLVLAIAAAAVLGVLWHWHLEVQHTLKDPSNFEFYNPEDRP